MFIDFISEQLPKNHYLLAFTRHKVIGGWLVRAIFTDRGHGAGGKTETSLFIADAGHSWQPVNFIWEKIQVEPGGGVYRSKVIGGWIIMTTAQGSAKTTEGELYRTRLGSLAFVPDQDHSWECSVIAEKVA